MQAARRHRLKWMAVPWQADTASCRSGYEPNTILFHVLASSCSESRISMDEYKRVIDIRLPLKDRLELSIHDQCG